MRFLFRHAAFTAALLFMTCAAHAKTASEIYEQASKSTVIVENINDTGKISKLGSGVVLPDGSVVTNCHVIKDASQLMVRRNKNKFTAALQYSDLDRDVCSLNIDGLNMPAVVIGSTSTLKVGAKVFAIGTPQGLELTLSDGIVSSLREVEGGHYIQITAAVSPGSSGGGLFDENGALVGLTTLSMSEGQNLNFAVPVEWVEELAIRSINAERKAEAEQIEAERIARIEQENLVKKQKAQAERKAEAEKNEAERKAEAEQRAKDERRAEAEQKAEADRKAEERRKVLAEKKAQAEERERAKQRELAEKKLQAEKELAELKAQAEQKAKAEQERIRAEQKALAEQERARAAQAAAIGKEVAEYTAKITAKIRRNIVMLPGIPYNVIAEFYVTLMPGGMVLHTELTKPSGSAAYDSAVERAIEKAQPLPLPPDAALFDRFRELHLTFRPIKE